MKSFALTLTHPEPIGESLPRFDSGYNQFLSELGAKLRVNRGAEGPGEIPQILIFKTLRMTGWIALYNYTFHILTANAVPPNSQVLTVQ